VGWREVKTAGEALLRGMWVQRHGCRRGQSETLPGHGRWVAPVQLTAFWPELRAVATHMRKSEAASLPLLHTQLVHRYKCLDTPSRCSWWVSTHIKHGRFTGILLARPASVGVAQMRPIARIASLTSSLGCSPGLHGFPRASLVRLFRLFLSPRRHRASAVKIPPAPWVHEARGVCSDFSPIVRIVLASRTGAAGLLQFVHSGQMETSYQRQISLDPGHIGSLA